MADGLKMAVVVLGLLAMVHQTMQLRITRPLPDLPEDGSANRPPVKGPLFAMMLASATTEMALKESGLFVRDSHTDIAGRRFNVGTMGGVPVVYALTGDLSSDAAVTTQLAMDYFPIRGIVHIGGALTLETSALPVGSVSIVKSVAHTGFWRWITLQKPKFDEVEASKGELRFGDFTYPNEAYNHLGAVQYDPVPVFNPEYTEKLPSKFWHDIDAEYLEIAAKGLKGLKLKKCYNSTHCLPTDPEIKQGLKASTSDIYIKNEAYGKFLQKKFDVATADQQSVNVVLTGKANAMPVLVIRAASSSMPKFDKTFSKLASHNAVLAANKFVSLFPVPRAAYASY